VLSPLNEILAVVSGVLLMQTNNFISRFSNFDSSIKNKDKENVFQAPKKLANFRYMINYVTL
jgi:hypothetical protein